MVDFAASATSSAPVMKLTKKIHNRFFFLDTNDESTKIASAGHGRTIFVSDVERGLQPVLKIERAHGSSISAICWYSENFIVTGDSKGRIKVRIRRRIITSRTAIGVFLWGRNLRVFWS